MYDRPNKKQLNADDTYLIGMYPPHRLHICALYLCRANDIVEALDWRTFKNCIP